MFGQPEHYAKPTEGIKPRVSQLAIWNGEQQSKKKIHMT